jgi:hypothetical protein
MGVEENKYFGIGKMISVLWRDSWLKPLSDFEIESEICKLCDQRFKHLDFVTSCEFCEIGTMHCICANNHILNNHHKEIMNKLDSTR